MKYHDFDELPYDFQAKFDGAKKGSGNIRKSKNAYVELVNMLIENNDILLSSYKSTSTEVIIHWGKCGHKTGIRPKNYKNGQGCSVCGREKLKLPKGEFSDEHRKHLSESHKHKKFSSEHKGKIKESLINYYKDEEHRAAIAKISREAWENEEYREKMSAIRKNMWTKDEYREKMAKRNEDMWKNSKRRYEASRLLTKMNEEWWKDDEYRKKKSITSKETMKRLHEDEDFKRKQIEATKKMLKIRWKDSAAEVKSHLRRLPQVEKWKKEALKQSNNICQISGLKYDLQVHHLYSFNLIVLDAHVLHNIEIKEHVKEYTEDELILLEDYVIKWHSNTNNAVVLNKEIHMKFHQEYGYGNNTLEQYNEFLKKYCN